jgi:hypothetical protein
MASAPLSRSQQGYQFGGRSVNPGASTAAKRSVFGGEFDMIDDEDIHRACLRHKFQAELLLQGGED